VAKDTRSGMRMATCPSCGGPLRFRGATSIVAVCAYCRSTLVRDGVKLEDIGKQAELLPDDSPIRLGTSGTYRGEGFGVVGRIQYRYAAGVWSEWHVLFAGGRSGWLSDASREYTITFLAPPAPVPAFEALKPGATLNLVGDAYSVTDLERAEVVAGEGELPFRWQCGWKAPVADLRGQGTRFATIDYSERTPLIYVGEKLPFDTFRFDGLRDPDRPVEPGARAIAFKCAGCGAPIEKSLATTKVVACGSCGTVTDVTGTVGELVQRNEANLKRAAPTIALGSVLQWRNAAYEAVGYLRRAFVADGARYEWAEYLLHNDAQGFLWISEYDSHFNVIRAATEVPKPVSPGFASLLSSRRVPRMRYLGRDFEHFQRCEPEVSVLAGEFYWRVQVGDRCVVEDYVAPPLILSSERTDNEITWSLGEYVEPQALWQAFGFTSKPPVRRGVAANQPSPHTGRPFALALLCFAFLAVAVLMQFGFLLLGSSRPAAAVPFAVTTAEASSTVSGALDLTSRLDGPVIVRSSMRDAPALVDLDLKLVDADSGRAYLLHRQIGRQGLPAESHDTDVDVAEIESLPSGRYTLAIGAKARSTAAWKPFAPPVAVNGEVSLYRQGPGWSNFVLLAGFLLLWPLVEWARARSFEKRRWAESDHPFPVPGDDDD
jgi:uncharacterized Zn finger protein (UPF0148 family)